MVTSSGRAAIVTEPPWPSTTMLSSPLVPLTVTLSAARSPTPLPGVEAQVDGDLRHAGTKEIVDGDRVGTAPGGEAGSARRR